MKYLNIMIIVVAAFVLCGGCMSTSNNTYADNKQISFTDVVEETLPGVAFIAAARDELRTQFGTGTGFFIDKNILVTNNHVIEGSFTVEIQLYGGYKLYECEIIGRDAMSDVAVLRVIDPEFNSNAIKVLKWGDSKDVRSGDPIYNIGHPQGFLWSVASGIISNESRRDVNVFQEVIQIDASINQGNSGGPLFNMDGEVIGINTYIISTDGDWGGLGFAVSQYTAEHAVNDIMEHGFVQRTLLGATINSSEAGLEIVDVMSYSAAEKAGLEAGDTIITYDGFVPVIGPEAFIDFLDYMNMVLSPGDTMMVKVERQNDAGDFEIVNIPVILEARLF